MRDRGTRVVIAIVVLAALAPASAQESSTQRGVPRATRDALLGCWQLPDEEVLVIEAEGESGLRARWRAVGRNGPESFAASMSYRPSERLVISGCGPQTQHGQECRFRVEPDGAVRAARVAGRSGRVTELSVQRCAPGTAEPSVASTSTRPIPGDAPARALLGARRRAIEAGRTPTGEDAGWVRYGDEIAIRYEAGLAMRVRARVGTASCEEAVRAAGFTPRPGTAPLRRGDGCEWPGVSARHLLAPRVAARYEAGVLEIWLR